jgi:prepilin-type processing-associated H-X9-DG protein
LAVIGATTYAQPLADRLPASTLVYLGWSPNASLQSTAAAKMLADERFTGPWRKMFQEFVLEMPDRAEGGGNLSAHLPQLLMDAAQCEGCFALLELKQGQRHFNPQSVLMIDLGAKRKSFEEHFKPVHARMKERVGERLQMMKLTNSWVWSKPDRDGKAQLTWGFVGDTFVFFTGDGAEDFIPKIVKGKIDGDLKSSPDFADPVGKISGESVFTTYLDAKGSLSVVRRLIEREGNNDIQLLAKNWDKLLNELGAANVKSVAEKTSIEDRQFVTRTLVRTDGAPTGILAQFAQPAVDDAMLKTVPVDAMAAAAFRNDLGKSYEQLKSSAMNLGGEVAREGIKEIERGASELGLPINKVLEPLGDQWVLYNAASHGGYAFTGWTLVCSVKDVELLKKNLANLRGVIAKAFGDGNAAAAAHVNTLEVDGDKIEFMELGRWSAPFAPAWCLAGDKFVFALYPQIVEDAVRHIRHEGKSILDNPEYTAARKRAGNTGPVVYVNGPEAVKNLYPTGLVVLNIINSFGGGFRESDDDHHAAADLFPSQQRLLQYVGHDCIDIKSTPDGLLKTRTVGNPLLSPLAWADSPILWLALGIPTLSGSEDAQDRITSATHLRQIGQGIMMYENENKGAAPPDLQTVAKTQDLSADVLKSPFGPAKNGKDFVMVNYPNNKFGPNAFEIVRAYDQAALEQGEGTNVLFADGHVDWLAPDNFKRALDESPKKAAQGAAQP